MATILLNIPSSLFFVLSGPVGVLIPSMLSSLAFPPAHQCLPHRLQIPPVVGFSYLVLSIWPEMPEYFSQCFYSTLSFPEGLGHRECISLLYLHYRLLAPDGAAMTFSLLQCHAWLLSLRLGKAPFTHPCPYFAWHTVSACI